MVYIADTNDYDDSFFENAVFILPHKKREEVVKIKHELSKKETVLAWALLRFVLNKIGKLDFPTLAYSEKGKPFFKKENLFFNLSHSKGKVCAAISDVGEIGIDVQKKSSFSVNMIKRVFAENECQLSENLPDKDSFFTRLWAIKESFLKNTGVGIAFDIRSLDFSKQCLFDKFEKDGLCYNVWCDGEFSFSVCAKEKGEQVFKNVAPESIIEFCKITAAAAKGEV